MHLSSLFLASGADALSSEAVTVLAGLLGLLTILVLILNAVIAWQRVFGRRIPIEVDLQGKADRSSVEKIELALKTFATARDLERHQEETRESEVKNADAFRELRTQAAQHAARLSAVQKQSDMLQAALTRLSVKVDRVIERRAALR